MTLTGFPGISRLLFLFFFKFKEFYSFLTREGEKERGEDREKGVGERSELQMLVFPLTSGPASRLWNFQDFHGLLEPRTTLTLRTVTAFTRKQLTYANEQKVFNLISDSSAFLCSCTTTSTSFCTTSYTLSLPPCIITIISISIIVIIIIIIIIIIENNDS